MKTKKPALIALALSGVTVVSVSPAWSMDQSKTNAGDDWAQHVQRQAGEPAGVPAQHAGTAATVATMSTTPLGPQAALFGSPAPANRAARAVTLGPGLQYVNVASGDTVTFKSGAQEATWTFAEFVQGKSIDLGVLFPALPHAQGVRVYIERSKLYTGG